MEKRLAFASIFVLAAACTPSQPSTSSPAATPTASAPIASATTTPATSTSAPAPTGTATAKVGAKAPDFTLPDLAGHPVHLADFAGKVVVLEWFNPGCPFVKGAHTFGGLKTLAKDSVAKGVVWLAINSAAAGKQGAGVTANLEAAAKWSLEHPILLDAYGDVGHAYGAAHTPTIFVIDTHGVIAYAGGLDDSRGAEPDKGDHFTPHAANAIDAVLAGKPVAVAETAAWGCSVKYAQ
jgi:peroxiredoxin